MLAQGAGGGRAPQEEKPTIVKRTSFLIFVLYRLALGLILFALLYDWIPGVNIDLTV